MVCHFVLLESKPVVMAEDTATYMRMLALASHPQATIVKDDPDRSKRCWIVRVRSLLPSPAELHAHADEIMLYIRSIVMKSFAEVRPEKEMTEEELAASWVPVALVRGGDYHLVAEISLPGPSLARLAHGGIDLFGTWSVLRDIHMKWEIEEIEGIPVEFWPSILLR